MPTLKFKGKQHNYTHHLTVSYCPPKPDLQVKASLFDDHLNNNSKPYLN